MPVLNAGRRHILRSGAGIVAACTAPAAVWAQSTKGNGRTPMVAQIVDVSTLQQDVSKDFLIGSRAAWQDINSRAGARGRTVQHLSIETDGSAGEPARSAGPGPRQPGLRRPFRHRCRRRGQSTGRPAAHGEHRHRPCGALAAGRSGGG